MIHFFIILVFRFSDIQNAARTHGRTYVAQVAMQLEYLIWAPHNIIKLMASYLCRIFSQTKRYFEIALALVVSDRYSSPRFEDSRGMEQFGSSSGS